MSFTGVKVIETTKWNVDTLYKEKEIEIWDNRHKWHQNMYVVIKSEERSSALAKVKGNRLVLIRDNISCSGVSPRNKEQTFALDCLLDNTIEIVVLTGKARNR